MADQKRWFKLWCSAPSDDDILALAPADRWAWAALGCYTKEHGTNGAVHVSPSNQVLAAQMGVPPDLLFLTIAGLPHLYLSNAPIHWPHGHEKELVCAGEFVRGGHPLDGRGRSSIEEWCGRNGSVIVTWKNWNKYQEDSTARQRGLSLRSKRRGEEKRREKEKEEKGRERHAVLADDAFIAELKLNLAYKGLDIDREAGKCRAWLLTPRGAGKAFTRQRFVNWLNRADVPITISEPKRNPQVRRVQE